MRRILVLLIAGIGLLFALGGCESGGDKTGSESPAEKTNEAPVATAPADKVEAPAPADKVEAPAAPEPAPEATAPVVQATPQPTPAPEEGSERFYYPFGKEGATVIIRPVGDAFIALVNGKIDLSDGKPVPVVEGLSSGYYNRVGMPPGKISLRIGSISTPTEAEIGFDAIAGLYLAQALVYTQDGNPMWTPVVTRGYTGGPIVAARGKVVFGLTPDKAIKLLSASNQDVDKVLSEVQKATKDELIERANTHFEAGRKFTGKKRFEEALKEFNAAIEIAPGFDSAYVYRGIVLVRLNRPQEALQSFDKALEAATKRRGVNSEWLSWPHYQKAMVLMGLRKYDVALAELDESIRLKPSVGALAARGNAYFVQGQRKSKAGDEAAARQFFLAARSDVNRGLALSGKNVQLWSMKSGVHFMLRETPQACEAAHKACELGNCSIVEDFPECKKGDS